MVAWVPAPLFYLDTERQDATIQEVYKLYYALPEIQNYRFRHNVDCFFLPLVTALLLQIKAQRGFERILKSWKKS